MHTRRYTFGECITRDDVVCKEFLKQTVYGKFEQTRFADAKSKVIAFAFVLTLRLNFIKCFMIY